MTIYQKNPIYNLSAVLRETGLKADLVRAWERRYDLPRPQRSAGGHRLYSQFDIETLKWLKEKKTQGLSISNAVELWKSLEQNGEDPLSTKGTDNKPLRVFDGTKSSIISELRENWIRACSNFDGSAAEETLNQAFATHSVESVVTEILQEGLREIGRGWHAGSLTVQQEHFASSLAERRLQTLLSLTPPPTRPQTVLLGCPPGELHALPTTIFDLFLRRKGFNVIDLGANIPLDQMVETAIKLRPDLIILSAQTLRAAASLLDAFTALRTTGIPLAYGGLIFNRVPALRDALPANFLGEDIHSAASFAEALLIHEKGKAIIPAHENKYPGLASQFLEKSAVIDFSVQERMLALGHTIDHIAQANRFFSESLHAVLKLGNPAYLQNDLDWVRLLLEGRRIEHDHLQDYLSAYRSALEEHMGSVAAPITQWLGTVEA